MHDMGMILHENLYQLIQSHPTLSPNVGGRFFRCQKLWVKLPP